jgi:hypothetical protein
MLTTTSAHHCRRFEIGGGAAVAGEVSISASSPPVPASSLARSINLLFYSTSQFSPTIPVTRLTQNDTCYLQTNFAGIAHVVDAPIEKDMQKRDRRIDPANLEILKTIRQHGGDRTFTTCL